MRSAYCKQILPCWRPTFQASATNLPMVIVLLKTAAFALYQKVAFEIHFIISFQYFINILVITVKAGWVFFFFIYEGTLRRCIFDMLWFILKKSINVKISRVTQAAADL